MKHFVLHLEEKPQPTPLRRWLHKNRQALWLGAGLLLVLAGVAYFALQPAPDWNGILDDSLALSRYLAGFGIWTVVLIAVIHVVLVVVAMLPAHLVVMASGYLYGLVPGFLLNHLAIALGSAVSFYIARRFGRPIVVRLVPQDILNRCDRAAEGHGFIFFLACYSMPMFPSDVLNFVGGLSPMRFSRFILANLLGRAWITFAITAAGTYSREIISLDISPFAWLIYIFASIVGYWIWQRNFKMKTQSATTVMSNSALAKDASSILIQSDHPDSTKEGNHE